MQQVDWIASSIPPDWQHVIVGGDFNTAFAKCRFETQRLMEEAGLQRASEPTGPTVKVDPLGLLRFQLDHVFTRGLHVVDCGVVKGAQASDHFPVWVTLQLDLN
jgi:endonuclease/exonuclease/phosphatase family metal-dependent hydrolase